MCQFKLQFDLFVLFVIDLLLRYDHFVTERFIVSDPLLID